VTPDLYPVIEFHIPDFPARQIEQLGSKPKFWFEIRGQPNISGLFKQTRLHTGEAWAECVTAALAEHLGIPHARYELAIYRDEEPDGESTRGVIAWSFLEAGRYLVLGNEVLSAIVSGYPRSTGDARFKRIPAHTVECVLEQCSAVKPPPGWSAPDGVADGADVMVGYLLLDAWISNTDRHDENWGWTGKAGDDLRIAPTFDHSSSLGRNEADPARERRLVTRDPGDTVEAYALRAPSGLHTAADGRRLRAIEAFWRAAELRPTAARTWLSRLASLDPGIWRTELERVPPDWASPVARRFAIGILDATRKRLLVGGTKQ